ncbi:unnamed protein product, partial [Rotaria magnacalcarata]
PCQGISNIEIFHDADHHIQYDYQQLLFCENGGQYFQSSIKCPIAATCACQSVTWVRVVNCRREVFL